MIQVEVYRGHQLTELADAFNKAVKHLKSKMAHVKSGIGEIEDAARDIQAEREDAIEILLKKIEIVEGDLSAFKIQLTH